MIRSTLALLILLLAAVAGAEDTYLGLYMQGQKVGHAFYSTSDTVYQGKPAVLGKSQTRMKLGLLGTPMTLEVDSRTWTTPAGKPIRMEYEMRSAGRKQTLAAAFQAKSVSLHVVNAGAVTKRTVAIPSDAPIVDDPVSLLLNGGAVKGAARSIYVLDPMTASFVKNQVRLVGPAKVKSGEREVDATLIEVVDPRTTMKVFVSAKGDLIRMESMGIEMVPETREVALGSVGNYVPSIDLALTTSLKTDRQLKDPDKITRLKMKVTGKDLSRLPSDTHQTVSKAGESWIVDVHPVPLAKVKATPIASLAKDMNEWRQPSLHIPSSSPEFRRLAREIVSKNRDFKGAALAIRRHVFRTMRPNAGIGVLRDASEVLKSREGVCRDYAILTATLLRSADIPARLASGLVNWDGTFYYHAWAEFWDGSQWVGLDSTGGPDQISATHVKLADGNVEQAFTFTFLDKVQLEVLDERRN